MPYIFSRKRHLIFNNLQNRFFRGFRNSKDEASQKVRRMIFAAYIYSITHIGISIAAQATVLSLPCIVVPRFPHLRRISGEHRQKRTEKNPGGSAFSPLSFGQTQKNKAPDYRSLCYVTRHKRCGTQNFRRFRP